jgi:pimeloyl-ACP methyl ester carboxylesterase
MLSRAFRDVHKTRDIVLVDQRGTGQSNPLRCKPRAPSLDELLRTDVDLDEIKTCLKKLDADPRFYTTPVAMDDLDDVRAALGYEQVNLWGGSYGTRAALEYMRRYPQRVRRAVLDGVAPTDIKLTVHAGRDAQRSLDLVSARCDADADCKARFGNIRAKFDLLHASLGVSGRDVSLLHPTTGEPITLLMSAERLAAIVHGILYAPVLSATLPIGLARAADGDWRPLLAAFLTIQGGVDKDLADGMFLSVVCAEDVPQITEQERSTLSNYFSGDTPVRVIKETCAAWPAATMPPAYFEPIVTDHPTLVLSGELDPITPPSWGELVTGRLPNASHHIVDGVGHGVTALPCVTKAIAEFLDAEPATVELDCPDVGLEFMVDASGARQ